MLVWIVVIVVLMFLVQRFVLEREPIVAPDDGSVRRTTLNASIGYCA